MVFHFLPFLTGQSANDTKETVHTMLGLNNYEMETKHDWVQWCFPNPQPSKTQPDVAQYPMERNEATLIASQFASYTNVCALLLKVFAFWGIGWAHDGMVGQSSFFFADEERFKKKLNKANHNQKRMTRVITFLLALGWFEVAAALQELLRYACEHVHGFQVSAETMAYWGDQNSITVWL